MIVCKDKENQLPGFRLVSRKTLSICNIAVAAGRGCVQLDIFSVLGTDGMS